MSTSIIAGAAFALAILAPAPTDVLAPAFTNTIVSLYPDGKTTKLWLNQNGSYDALRANGQRTGGTWVLKGDKLCITQRKPFLVPLAFCTPIPSMKGGIGASWTAKGLKGEQVRHTLTAGR